MKPRNADTTFTLAVPKLKEAIAWYTRFLGVPPEVESVTVLGRNARYFEFQNETQIFLVEGDSEAVDMFPFWLGVPDLNKELDRLLVAGLKPLRVYEPKLGSGRHTDFLDPYGYRIGFFELKTRLP